MKKPLKLVLDVLSQTSLNFMTFSGDFLVRPASPAISLTHSFLVYWRCSAGTFWAMFHLRLICSFQVLKFQMSSYQQKVQFRLLLGGVLDVTQILCWIFLQKKLKNNSYSRSLLDPENWWWVLVQFEIFEEVLDTVKDSYIKK